MKIVIAEKTAKPAIEMFKSEPGWTVITPDQIGDGLAAHLADADALLVRSAVKVDAKLLSAAKKLRVIGRAGVGVDNIDLPAATKKGIVVMNTPGGNAVAVAELTFGMMLSLARNLTTADVTTRAGQWEKKSLQGTELRGKTLGIVGLGRIGIEVARRARAFQMKVVAHDPFVAPALARDLEITLAPLNDVFAAADYLSLHVGLTPQTQEMINAAAIARMKKGVRIVNCARGELIDEAALAEGLKSGQVGGAALDVYRTEPPKGLALLALPNVVATPHIAGSTGEAQEAVGIQIAQQVKEYLKRGVIQNAVNVPSVGDEEYAEMAPYLAMAEKLGSFLAQIAAGGGAQEIELKYSGRIAEFKTELVRNAALMGALNSMQQESANLVNAAQSAQERGIRIAESRPPAEAGERASGVLSISLKAGNHFSEARGTVLYGKNARLVHCNGIDIEAPLGGNLIYMRNLDVPGVIGKVGTLLGRHRVNIANMALGRGENIGEVNEALALIVVDGEIPAVVLEELRGLEPVQDARAVRL